MGDADDVACVIAPQLEGKDIMHLFCFMGTFWGTILQEDTPHIYHQKEEEEEEEEEE
jgi:hypothetical protein